MTRVLVAEDSATQAEELRLLLETRGYQVAVARDGREALRLFAADAFDVVISDVVMPGLSGYELCRQLKGSPRGGDVPFLLVTALADPLDIIKGLECGADNFITKPYDGDYLVQRVEWLLGNRRLRGSARVELGVEVMFLGRRFTISSAREQILDLLMGTFEDIVRTNRTLEASRRELEEANARAEEYARQLEGRARTSEEKYRRLMEQAAEAIFVADLEGRVTDCNRRAEELLGRGRADLLGLPSGEVVGLDLAGDERLGALVPRGRAAVRAVPVAGAGGVRLLDMSVTRVDVGGERLLLAIGRDVTEQLQDDERRLHSQRLEAIGRLAGGVAHDFNNLLTAINGHAELLQDQFLPDDPARRDVSQILRAGNQAAALTRQLLAFGRKQMLQPRVLDLGSTVQDATAALLRLLGEDIRLRTVVADDVGRIRADPLQVQQVLVNLGVNARDAMPDGGTLTVEIANAQLDEDYCSRYEEVVPGDYVMMAVADTGSGMTPEVCAHVFEPFFTTKELGKGTGLGLSTVYGIVKQSGGHIAFETEVGRGSTFRVYLPRVDAGLPARAEAAPASRPTGTETVLLVEDDEGVRELARALLEAAGFRVIPAACGGDAIDVARSSRDRIHVVLTDVVMPDLGGEALHQRILEHRPGTPVVYMSGYPGDALPSRDGVTPGAPFVQKPFSAHALLTQVRAALDRVDPPRAPTAS